MDHEDTTARRNHEDTTARRNHEDTTARRNHEDTASTMTPPRRHEDTKIRLMGRREALAILGATGAVFAAGCAADSPTNPSAVASAADTAASGSAAAGTATGAACAVTPNETIGPYPSLVDLFRSDIRESKAGTQLDL